jgi:hypothetical protein
MSAGILAVTMKDGEKYIRNIMKLANSEKIQEMGFEERLMKLVDMLYLPEELDAIFAKD